MGRAAARKRNRIDEAPSRDQLVSTLEGRLRQKESPRAQMAVIAATTGACGLLASVGLLRVGVRSMAWRYSTAVLIAYMGFLLLIGVWVWVRRRMAERQPSSAHGHSDDLGSHLVDWPKDRKDSAVSSVVDALPVEDVLTETGALGIVLAAVAVTCLVFGYVIAFAPTFFAELLLDGVLSAALYRRLNAPVTADWLRTAIRRSWLPFAVVVGTAFVVGVVLERYAPEAVLLRQVIAHWWAARAVR